ncbi:MAG: DUF1045 domain-containing protein [Tistlia sp.]|uniref:DUF1045 domain-containing protein n=1 Tax=Tistlia sp. TaxID=3057121 RepID=UPI0034A1D4F7
MRRYALYFTPPGGSPLADLGACWFTDPAVTDITARPSLYGFHATLKAPFRLAAGREEGALLAALDDFCAARPPVGIGRLLLAELEGFLALVPARQSAELERLAADCVAAFDGFRAPAGEAERARRRAAGLSARQERHLLRWGYPYVADDFLFHMTLSRRLDPAEAAAAKSRLAPLAAPALAGPVLLDALSLSVQPAAGAPFEVRRRIALSGG